MKTIRASPFRARPVAPNVEVARPAVRAPGAVPLDLVTVLAAALAGLAAVLLDAPGLLRVLFGVPLVLFLPGYALVSALFPRADAIDGVERVALGFGLSLAAIPTLALVLDRSRWSIATEPFAVALVLATAVAATAGAYRRARLAEGERLAVAFPLLRLPTLPPWDRPARLGAGLMLLALVLLAAGGGPALYARLTGPRLTEFALYAADGRPAFYDRQVMTGEPEALQLGITNREGGERTYAIAVGDAGATVAPLPPVTVADGETWHGSVRFVVAEEGERLPVGVELRLAGENASSPPYRTLRLMVDAAPPGSAPAAP